MKREDLLAITTIKESPDEVLEFLTKAISELKQEIPDLNKGCCGYLAYKIAQLLLENQVFTFVFGTIFPLWSKTGLKAFSHIWIAVEIFDGDTIKTIDLNKREKGGKKTEVEYVKQFYILPALKESLTKENSWAWGHSFTEENKIKIDEKISLYMKEKTIHYSRDCKNAMELVGENIRACSRLSGKDITVPFTVEDSERLLNKWIENKESTKQDIIKSIDLTGIVLMSSNKFITFAGLLERYIFLDKKPCGIIKQGKRIGCHTRVNCEQFIKK